MKIVVGSAPGGGYDTYARVLARYLGKFIPGTPTVIVENQPGAGSLKAANQVYKTEAKDGTVIAHIQGGIFLQQLLGLDGVEFDALKWQAIGVPAQDNNLCLSTAKSGIKSFQDVMKPNGKQYIVGGNAPGSATWDVPMRLANALDLNVKMVDGYDGTAKVRLAMDQGEVDGICGWGYESVKATAWDRVQAKDYLVLAQVTDQPLKGLEGTPSALDMAKSDEAKQMIRLGIIVPSQILRPFLMAPEVPADRVAAVRQAFNTTMEDKEFRAEAEKAQLEVDPIAGPKVEQLIKDLFTTPENIKTRLKAVNERKA